MAKRSRHSGRGSPVELPAAAVLLAALPAVVLALLLARGSGRTVPASPAGMEPEVPLAEEVVMQPQYAGGASARTAAPGKTADLAALLPRVPEQSPFRVSSPVKQWTAEKMHEKINGEDEVYLKAGCLGLAAMTLSNGPGTETIDLYLFEMRAPGSAEKVFAEQAPPGDAPTPADRPTYVDLGDKAYTTYGSCYLRVGRFYLKVLVNGESKGAADAAMALARKFAEQRKEHQ